MKNVTKILIGLGAGLAAGLAAGLGATFLGKNNDNDTEVVVSDIETEDDDQYSNEEE